MIGVLGGTFDPVHNGHCRIALEIYQQLSLDELRFVPCRQPPHRSMPQAGGEQRLAMLQLAIAGQPEFIVDERELRRDGPSYMVDTLASMRAEEPDVSLCLILGGDAFAGLMSWHHWRQILDLAHLVIAHRPGAGLILEGELLEVYQRCQVRDVSALQASSAGRIFLCPVTQLDISSTRIREQQKGGGSARYLLPDDVWVYMQQQQLYT
jgi:nicotinate-nucleotide adenylyltransferase